MAERRAMGIEAVLSWAYRDELPKAQPMSRSVRLGGPSEYATAWSVVRERGMLGTDVDASENRYGIVADLAAIEPPHPDAVAVGDAVNFLDTLPLDLPEGWNPIAELGDLDGLAASAIVRGVRLATEVDREGARRMRAPARHLVVRHANHRSVPSWEAEVPEIKVERHANGTPKWFVREVMSGDAGLYEVDVDGFDRRRRIPKPGAYQRRYLDPDPAEVVVERAEYQVWRAALDVLTEQLAGLDRFEVLPSTRAWAPWEERNETVATGRVLRVGLSTATLGAAAEGGWMSLAEFQAGRS